LDSKSLMDQLRGTKPTPTVHDPSIDKKPPPEEAEELKEASDRCGLWSPHNQQGVVLDLPDGTFRGPFYGMIVGEPQSMLPNGLRFRYETDEGLWEVQIIGNESPESIQGIRLISRQIIWGKRALVNVNHRIVVDIKIVKIEEEEEET
jgi:hypothetical protein